MYQTEIKKWRNSQAVMIPKALLQAADLTENEKVELAVDHGEIRIRKVEKPKITLAGLFAGYTGSYQGEEIDWGTAVGEECGRMSGQRPMD